VFLFEAERGQRFERRQLVLDIVVGPVLFQRSHVLGDSLSRVATQCRLLRPLAQLGAEARRGLR